MDFGDIFNTWEKQQKKSKKKNIMEKLLDDYLPDQENFLEKKATRRTIEKKIAERRKMLAMKPQKEIDLHGYTVKEAIIILEKFLQVCKKENLKKVLIIHGKGHHSPAGPVLQKKVLQYIQASPLTGAYGFAGKTMGGRGALWVLLRQVTNGK